MTPAEREQLKLALDSIEAREFDTALIRLQGLVRTGIDQELVNALLGSVYAESGMDQPAIVHFERVLAINPQNPLALYWLEQLRAGVREAS